MKITTIILILFFGGSTFSQEHSSLFDKKCLRENKVHTIIEYDPNDSINFFAKYPNGYYSKYDVFGRIVESNSYIPTYIDTSWIAEEVLNYYLYDSLDNQIAFIQINKNFQPPFRYIELKSFGYKTGTVNRVSLESPWVVNSNFIFSETNLIDVQNETKTDTIILSAFHKRVIFNHDSLSYIEIFLNKYSQPDSTFLYSVCSDASGQHRCETKTVYEYSNNATLAKKVVQVYQINTEKFLYSQFEYFYLPNGLLDYRTFYFTSNGVKQTSKFKYSYRPDWSY